MCDIKREKDRGKDVDSSTWYCLFKGDRINDYHLTNEEKRAARSLSEKSGGRFHSSSYGIDISG